MRFVVMVEGQEDVTWADWLALAEAAERLGFDGLFRSDHYGSVEGVHSRGSLDAWGTICALAAVTERVRLGTLVSPATFRHPSVIAKLAVTADHVSGGRVELGLGTGWNEAEHRAYGFPFPSMKARMDGMAEQLEIISRSFAEDGPFSFAGEHFTVEDLDARPKPVQSPLPIVMGGAAGPRASRLAARYAAEYNTFADVETAKERRATLAAACEAEGRDPATLGFSLMTSLLIGADEADLEARARALAARRGADVDLAGMRDMGMMVGTPDELVERLQGFAAAGVGRVYLQLQLHQDLEQLELVAERLAPAFAG